MTMDEATRQQAVVILNEGVTNELGAVIQYLWHHYLAEGIESPAIRDIFEKFSLDEMKHLEQFSERIVDLGGEPTTKLNPVKKGGTLRQMIQDDLDLEQGAVQLYKGHVRKLAELGDTTSRLMVEKALAEEEGHVTTFRRLLSKLKG